MTLNFKELERLRGTGKFATVTLATPEQVASINAEYGKCHENVDRWISSRPEHEAVRGWLFTGYFVKHSVVRIGANLLDITPRYGIDAQLLLDFIEHDDTMGDFAACPVEFPPWL